MKAAIYARVSQSEQEPENQLRELRICCDRRGWAATEYVDRGVSGAKDRRPALDEFLAAAKRRKFDVLAVWRLDRLGRNLRHLILLLDEFQALGFRSSHWARALTHPRRLDGCSSTSCRRVRSSSARGSENECLRDSRVC